MATSYILALTGFQAVALLLGIVTNGFMLGVNLVDWVQLRSLTASDHFICAVGLCNFFLQIWLGLGWFCHHFWNVDFFCRTAYALKMISTHSSLTVSGLLCVFYCTRILTFNHTLFRMYQRHFLRSFRQIIIRSFIICFMMGWPLFWVGEKPKSQNVDLSFPNGSSVSGDSETQEETYFGIYRVLVLSFGYTVPLALTVSSASLIIVSLIQHTRRMRSAFHAKREAFIDAQIRAGFTILSLLLLFVMYFSTAIINIIQIFNEGDLGFALCQVISVLYAPAVSIVLIRGNSKLKKAAAKAKESIVWALQQKPWIKKDEVIYITQK